MEVKKQIILNIRRDDVRVAVRENEDLTQFYIERGDLVSSVGNIIKGRVESVRKELEAVFVDIGEDGAGFLPMKDLYSYIYDKKNISKGSEIVVQVKKEAYGTKGARLTTFIAIPGRSLVLIPFKKTIGISKTIIDPQERKRLREMAKEICPKNMGLIIRTVASGKDKRFLKRELSELMREWIKIKKKIKIEPIPSILREEEELPIKITRDLLDDSVAELIVDSEQAYKKIKDYLSIRKSPLISRIKLYKEPIPVFTHYGIEHEMRKIFKRKVWLKSGGYIVIDRTEALTVFDVNTGKYKGKMDSENMIYKTNSEAAEEIARQLRLRDIGGIIVIDFIDMKEEKRQKNLLIKFKSYLRGDKARFKMAFKLSPLGLLELTRERVRRSVSKRFVEPCPYCQGKGHVLSPPYLFSKFTTFLEAKADSLSNSGVRILANPRVAHYFETEGRDSLMHFSHIYQIHIEVVSKEDQPIESVEVITLKKGEVIIEEL